MSLVHNNSECLCCRKLIPETYPRICPLCNHIFQGNGWVGIDAHWRAKHENVIQYEEFWESLCNKHRQTQNG